MSRLPTLRQIQYFVAVADHLSFSAAAAQCLVTQSTLSAGLGDLEDILGEKLFERTSRSVTLTPTGQDLLAPARKLLDDAADFVLLAGRTRTPLTGLVSLGAIPTIAPYLFPRFLPRVGADFPALDLHLREGTTAQLLDHLAHNRLDVALMAFPYDTPGMETRMLWEEPFIIAQPDSLPGKKGPATPDDLDGVDLLLLDDGHCLRDHAMAACRLRGAAQRKTFGATSLQTLIQMVQNGYGVTLLPEMAVDAERPLPGIRLRRFKAPAPTRTIGLAWRKGHPRSYEFGLLGDSIVKSMGKD
jgi:LysR family hydrogen peroxide-inducible transcriptional activator